MTRLLLFFLIALISQIIFNYPTSAQVSNKIGLHILNPSEVNSASFVLKSTTESWSYITIPFTLEDMQKTTEWRQFFLKLKELKFIPIIRLTTKFDGQNWQQPTEKDIYDLIFILDTMPWPTKERYLIIFNEVNHSKEWGGKIDPISYTKILTFTSQLAKATNKDFKILPAAMDLDAPNSKNTQEAFNYLKAMFEFDPEWTDYIDYWNSHSYPNPAFSAPPIATGKNSLRGFQYELAYIKKRTNKELAVFITETGWKNNQKTQKWLNNYYLYAFQHIWSDSRVIAVTPFILKGDPGPFAQFGFLDKNGKPTAHYLALRFAIEKSK